jgi:membrane-associated protein
MSSLLVAVDVHRHLHGPSIDYAGVGAAAVAGWVGAPGVGEAALIAGGILAARGKLGLAEVVTVAWLGATLGGVAGWVIGMKVGHAVFAGPGPFRRVRLKMLDRGASLYERWGGVAVFFTPAWLAGINRMASRSYLVLNAISAFVWAIVVGVGAYVLGPSIEDVWSDIGLAGAAIVIVLAVLGTGGGLLSRRRRRATADSRD